jgi:hypothetical protein
MTLKYHIYNLMILAHHIRLHLLIAHIVYSYSLI